MITKKNLPMRAIFFRDHEISRLRPAAAPSPVGRPEGQAKISAGRNRPVLCPFCSDSEVAFAP
jgi:hypothetical protein